MGGGRGGGDGDGGLGGDGGEGEGGGGLGGGIGGGEGESGGGLGGCGGIGGGGGEGEDGGGLGGGRGGGDGDCGEAGGGILLQQASLQFAESDFFFFVVEHNLVHSSWFDRLHAFFTFFLSFCSHVFLSVSAAQSFGDGAEAKHTGNHCGGTALISDWRAWAVELGLDEINGLMVLVPVVPASMKVANLRNGSRVMILSSTFHGAVSKTSNVFDRLPTQLKLTICRPFER